MVWLDIRNPIVLEQRAARSAPSSLSIIEAAYDLEADDEAWLGTLLQEVRPFIDHGLGAYAHFYETSSDFSAVQVRAPIFVGCKPGFFEAIVTAARMLEARHLRAAYGGSPCQSFSQAHARVGLVYSESEAMRLLARESGTADLLIVNAWQGGVRGCSFIAAVDRERRYPARTASTLGRATRHIAAAHRLRQVVQRGDGRVSLDAEAVLDARGAVLHAEGEAKGKLEREVLAATTRALVRVQERWGSQDPEQVALHWNALVDGRWSLVDSFDNDGKRFLLARRNALELPEPSALTPAERQVAALFARGHSSKLVAYELGLSASAVSSTLKRALRKLHLKSRTELVALFCPR